MQAEYLLNCNKENNKGDLLVAKTKSVNSFTNAMIDVEKDVIVELLKDGVACYSLSGLLEMWDKVDGVSITIQKAAEIEPDSDEY